MGGKAGAGGGSGEERLKIRESVTKKLLAWSGNQCANPECCSPLVDPKGTMIGRIAHIHAA